MGNFQDRTNNINKTQKQRHRNNQKKPQPANDKQLYCQVKVKIREHLNQKQENLVDEIMTKKTTKMQKLLISQTK